MKRQYIRLGWWYGCAVLYLWFFAVSALHAYRHPFLNWDMIAYMGVAESFSSGDPQKIYDATMERARDVYPPGAYENITRKNALSNQADVFYQQLPLYSIKPLYTGGIWLLDALGMPMPKATWVLSISGFLGLGTVCYFFVPAAMDAGAWWIIVWLFCAYGPWPMRAIVHLSTPDTLCIALSAAGYCLWVYSRSFAGFAACFLLAQLARPDTLLLSSPLALFFTFFAHAPYRLTRRQGVGFTASAVILYMAVHHLAGNYGWKALFYYNFIHKSAHPAVIVPLFGWRQYVNIVYYGIVRIAANARLQWLFAASLAASACHCLLPTKKRVFIGILWLAWLVFAARFMLFPAWGEDRYYYPYYFIMLYALAETISPYLYKYFAETKKLFYR